MSLDRRILIADDEPEIRLGVADLLGPLGLEVVLAETGSEAMHLLRGGGLHLAVLDYRMPGATGLEVLQAIQNELLGIPAILCSAEAEGDVGVLARQAGALAVLSKPVPPLHLKREVVRALELPPSMGLSALA